jgi:hypothetical protein
MNTERLITIFGRKILGSESDIGGCVLSKGAHRYIGGSLELPDLRGLNCLPLPHGPVATLGESDPGDIAQGWYRFIVGDGTQTVYVRDPTVTDENDQAAWKPETRAASSGMLDAPATLVCDRNGGNPRVVQFVGPRTYRQYFKSWNPVTSSWKDDQADFTEFTTTAWLHGLYNSATDLPHGPSGTTPGDLVIGWWPRYPSALPADNACSKEHFRCRTYAWAGFPLRYYNSMFSPDAMPSGVFPGDVGIGPDGDSNGFFTLNVRAMSEGTDWTQRLPQTLPVGTQSDWAKVFDAAFAKSVDGAELRVTWHYGPRTTFTTPAETLAAIAAAGNRAPRIGPVTLRCRAPCMPLETTAAR